MAAALLAKEAHDLPITVVSLGTLELGPVPPLPEAVEAARSFGLDLSSHRARSIVEVDLEPYDLVLGFERMHVAGAVVDARAHLQRTFTLPELVELLEANPAAPTEPEAIERARVRIREANAGRPTDYAMRAVPEIADPLGKTQTTQRETAAKLRDLVVRLAGLLFA